MGKQQISTKGIVLREVMLGESDKLLTVLSADLGRITVRCRGVRTLKSRRFAAAQTYIYSDMLLSEKDGNYTLEEAELIESFFELRERLEAIACAGYFADLMASVTMEGEGDSEVMSLFLNSLYALAHKKEISVRRIKAVFEARLAALLGFMPDLSVCALCGKEEAGFLNVAGGELLCGDCTFSEQAMPSDETHLLLPISHDVLALFRYVVSCDKRRIFSFHAEDNAVEAFGHITERYLVYHLEKQSDTLTFLHSVL